MTRYNLGGRSTGYAVECKPGNEEVYNWLRHNPHRLNLARIALISLCELTRAVSNVNLPNTEGQISNLPRETVVETNALFSLDDVRPVAAGSLSGDIYKLIKPHADNQSEILHAALYCDKDAVYRAFTQDPLVAGRCSEKDAQKLADDMISDTLKYLPDGWRA